MQAIHHAAIGGHVELLVLLIEQFGVSPQEKADVRKSGISIATFPLHIFSLACSKALFPPISSTAKGWGGDYTYAIISVTI